MAYFRSHPDEVWLSSPATSEYNCFAWALGVNNQSIWPDPERINSWPNDLPRDEKIDTVVAFIERLGFVETSDGRFEGGYTKIAIHLDSWEVAHVSRLTPHGYWESKLGAQADVRHHQPASLSEEYGSAFRYFKLPDVNWPPRLPEMFPGPAKFIGLGGGRLF